MLSLAEDQCERRANRKTQASDFEPKKKEELQEGDLLKARGRGAFEVAES